MAEVTVLAVGGTGESHVGDHGARVRGLLSAVTDELDSRFDSRWVAYPASYGPVADGGLSFRHSTAMGVKALTAEIAQTDGPVMLIGYSQGCTVIRSALPTLNRANIIGVGLISDPQQPADVIEGCEGHGVAGDGPEIQPWIPVKWIGHPQDMICNASDDSYIRDIADLTRWMSFSQARVWAGKVWELLRSNAFQNAQKTRFSPKQWRTDLRRIRTAFLEVLGYLPTKLNLNRFQLKNPRGGRHISYAIEPLDESGLTGCELLASWMKVHASGVGQRIHAA
ncbi:MULTISPECIES: PE-PPE domain-containing protein [Rhodococcus]|uniref:PE-PPE domain-containing protein n=1 Tax=Rhodococcus qingshengii JCM 15477 TaxID=1303681 RepID=A0AB38R808_RHOSG|nr:MULTISPECIES: PE-PPE domain-containing protein [Rhodococcus]UPU41403.1 PE-PPE domain-containing protein [Rhodococcus qingshengii JCM 15477]